MPTVPVAHADPPLLDCDRIDLIDVSIVESLTDIWEGGFISPLPVSPAEEK